MGHPLGDGGGEDLLLNMIYYNFIICTLKKKGRSCILLSAFVTGN